MKSRVQAAILLGITVAAVSGHAIDADANTITLDAVTRGYFREDDGLLFMDPLGSYAVGRSGYTWRNAFVFDLSGVTGITSATLHLKNPPFYLAPDEPFAQGFQSSVNSSETFQVVQLSTPIPVLLNPTFGSDYTADYNAIASGTLYGSVEISVGDIWVDITLNMDAISALNAADDYFALAGMITTLTGNSSDKQGAFFFSGLYASQDWAQLIVTTTPVSEPNTTAVLSLSLAALGFIRRRLA